jgi:hypothetical protein
MTSFRDVLPEGLAEELPHRIVTALQHTYAMNAERHDPSLGDDGLTFGVGVWRNSWHGLEEAVEPLPDVSSERPDGSLVLVIGATRIHSYKVGNTEELDIATVRFSGTATKSRIVRSNAEQLQLFDSATTLAPPANLVLAHAGNPFDGLCAVYVGVPTEGDSGPSWHWVEELFRIPPSDIRRSEPIAQGPTTPYSDMPVTDFDLTLKPEVDEQESHSDET